MKFVSILFMLVIVSLFLVSMIDNTQSDIEHIRACNVLITNGQGHGSGVYLGNGVILTAGHCTSVNGTWVEDMNGNVYPILDEKPVGDLTEDIGFVFINPKANIPAMTRFGDMPDIGDVAHICGNPLEIFMIGSFTTGTITKLRVDFPNWWDNAIISDAVSVPGNSGGGVYNEDLELIGIVVGCYVGFDSITIVEPIEDILAMMELEL